MCLHSTPVGSPPDLRVSFYREPKTTVITNYMQMATCWRQFEMK